MEHQFRVIPQQAREGLVCQMSVTELMLVVIQLTPERQGDTHQAIDSIQAAVGNTADLKKEDLFSVVAECWALKSKVPFADFWNAVTNGRYSEEIFADRAERQEFLDAIDRNETSGRVIDVVVGRISK